jgi:hypothetical protein
MLTRSRPRRSPNGSLPNRSVIAALHHVFLQMLLLSACSDPQSPEAQVRAVIDAMQTAAEARDASDVMDFVASDFRSAEGQDFADMQRYLRGYLLAHPSVHLLTRIDALEFPVAGEARMQLSVGMAGKAVTAGAWDLSADLQQLDLVLRQQQGHWKVVYAARLRQ